MPACVSTKLDQASEEGFDWSLYEDTGAEFDPTDPDDWMPRSAKRYIGQNIVVFPEHIRVYEAFAAAGFIVKVVEKLWYHENWVVTMDRGTADLPLEYRPALRRIKTLLRGGELCSDDFAALRISGKRMWLSFTWKAGEVGFLVKQKDGIYVAKRTEIPQPEPEEDVPYAP
jgi:hypothetical protein